MLRVGLTGNLGSGKSTVARMLRDRGADVLASDEIGRALMQPGTPVFEQIVATFGNAMVMGDGRLDRSALAKLAFEDGRVEELNAIVHPAVIEREAEVAAELFARRPEAILVVESALIFETKYGGGAWRERFHHIVLVTAPEAEKIARFVRRQQGAGVALDRGALEEQARRRLHMQIPDAEKARHCDFVLSNDGSVAGLEEQVDALWRVLLEKARRGANAGGNARESLQ